MCGIIGVISRRPTRPVPIESEIVERARPRGRRHRRCRERHTLVGEVDALLKGLPGVMALVDRPQLLAAITARLDQLDAFAAESIDDWRSTVWRPRSSSVAALNRSRCETCRGPSATTVCAPHARSSELAGRDAGEGPLAAYLAIQQALSALDRLEVRGRDSAGIHVFVRDHGLDLTDPSVQAAIRERTQDPTFQSGSVRIVGTCCRSCTRRPPRSASWATTPAALRAAVAGDQLLAAGGRRAVGADLGAGAHAVGERRHHLRAQRPPDQQRRARVDRRRAVSRGRPQRRRRQPRRPPRRAPLRIHAQITTDAKVIPALVSRYLAAGHDEVESFRRTVAAFDGLGRDRRDAARPTPIRSCSPSAAAARGCTSASPRTRSSSPASPTAWSRRRSQYLRLDGEPAVRSSRSMPPTPVS